MMLACQGELVIVPDNTAPDYSEVPTLKIKNYVNRMSIDLLGREPVDAEMDAWVNELKAGDLHKDARLLLVRRMMEDTSFVEGDSSYSIAYYNRFYDLMKVRFLEGAGEDILVQRRALKAFDAERDSLNGNWAGYQIARFEMQKLENVMNSRINYRKGRISLFDMAGYMVYNSVYDEINMNSINFIRATFNDLFFRYHTQDEFDRAFQIIEFSQPAIIFGKSAGNKLEYIDVLTGSRECYEAMIRWAYQGLLAREPSAEEVTVLMDDFFQTGNYQMVQQHILVSDEYARF
ncbi:MAG: hypothetical protein R3B47_15755 [Bacteroidia bacterium]